MITGLVVLLLALSAWLFYEHCIRTSKDGLTQSEADDVVLAATHMGYGFSNFSLGQAKDKIKEIDRKLMEVENMDDAVMRRAWQKWLNHYRRTALSDVEWYSRDIKTEVNRRKVGL